MEALVKFRMMNLTNIDPQITDAVTFAYDELTTSIRVPENQETASVDLVEGQSNYAVPLDLFAIVSIRNIDDGKRLTPMSARSFDRAAIVQNGEPKRYMWWKNELLLLPANNATTRALRMRYIKRLDALSTAATLSALPREWDEIIVQGAVFRLLSWLGDKQAAQTEKAEYLQMITRRIDRISETDFDREDTAKPHLVEKTENLGSGE